MSDYRIGAYVNGKFKYQDSAGKWVSEILMAETFESSSAARRTANKRQLNRAWEAVVVYGESGAQTLGEIMMITVIENGSISNAYRAGEDYVKRIGIAALANVGNRGTIIAMTPSGTVFARFKTGE